MNNESCQMRTYEIMRRERIFSDIMLFTNKSYGEDMNDGWIKHQLIIYGFHLPRKRLLSQSPVTSSPP